MKKSCELCGKPTNDTRLIIIRFIGSKAASAGIWGNYKGDFGHTRICDNCGTNMENVARLAVARYIDAIQRAGEWQ